MEQRARQHQISQIGRTRSRYRTGMTPSFGRKRWFQHRTHPLLLLPHLSFSVSLHSSTRAPARTTGRAHGVCEVKCCGYVLRVLLLFIAPLFNRRGNFVLGSTGVVTGGHARVSAWGTTGVDECTSKENKGVESREYTEKLRSREHNGSITRVLKHETSQSPPTVVWVHSQSC
jgi:hypothetical protein